MNELDQPTQQRQPTAWMIVLALAIAILPSVLIFAMVNAFKGRSVSTTVLVGECLFCLACCSAPSILLFRSRPGWAVIIAVIFIPINVLTAFFFGCSAVLSAH